MDYLKFYCEPGYSMSGEETGNFLESWEPVDPTSTSVLVIQPHL